MSGTSRTTTAGANGSYTLDTTGLTGPFLVQATTSYATLYSVSADLAAQSTINVTPLTDLIIRSWYDVQGTTVTTAFAAPAATPAPTAAAVSVIGNVVTNIAQLWLNKAGVTASGFNLISTPFLADHSGIDQVLDRLTIDVAFNKVTFTDSVTTQQSLVTYSTTNGSMTVSTTTTAGTTTTTSTNGTVVPVQTAQQAALAGITATINDFAATVNTKGTGLQVTDLYLYMDPALINGGLGRTDFARQLIYLFGGKTVAFSGIQIGSLDMTANVARTVFQLSQTQGGQTSKSLQELSFKKINSSWLLTGDQRILQMEARAGVSTNQGLLSSQRQILEVNADAPHGTVTGVTVSGGPWPSAIALPAGSQNVAPWDATLTWDSFSIYDSNSPTVSAGAPFTYVVTPATGAPVSYTLALNGITTEAIVISNLTGSTLADAHLGTPLTATWALPKTFALSELSIGAVAFTGDPNSQTTLKCDDMGAQTVLGITATTAQVTIPATCGGKPTLQAEISLQAWGVNGEFTTAYYEFK